MAGAMASGAMPHLEMFDVNTNWIGPQGAGITLSCNTHCFLRSVVSVFLAVFLATHSVSCSTQCLLLCVAVCVAVCVAECCSVLQRVDFEMFDVNLEMLHVNLEMLHVNLNDVACV